MNKTFITLYCKGINELHLDYITTQLYRVIIIDEVAKLFATLLFIIFVYNDISSRPAARSLTTLLI